MECDHQGLVLSMFKATHTGDLTFNGSIIGSWTRWVCAMCGGGARIEKHWYPESAAAGLCIFVAGVISRASA